MSSNWLLFSSQDSLVFGRLLLLYIFCGDLFGFLHTGTLLKNTWIYLGMDRYLVQMLVSGSGVVGFTESDIMLQ